MESWKSIPGYPEYEASTLGRIRRVHVLRPALHSPGKRGYLHLIIQNAESGQKHWFVHNLILLTFYGPKPINYVVNHKDGNRLNNCPNNLQYVTKRENYDHALKHGLYKRGEELTNSKLTCKQVRIIRKLYKFKTYPLNKLAMRFGVSLKCIHLVVKLKTWKHVT